MILRRISWLLMMAYLAGCAPSREPDDPQALLAKQSVARHEAWFEAPCLPDSADDFEWTRYDLHGIRIRVPREVTQVKHPSVDELHFRIGRSTMRLRLHRDASGLFAEYYTPPRTRRHCWGDVGGLMAEAISFGAGGGRDFGFAARWADADRTEWLAAVIHGTRLNEVTLLRRTLFTIAFPDEKRPF